MLRKNGDIVLMGHFRQHCPGRLFHHIPINVINCVGGKEAAPFLRDSCLRPIWHLFYETPCTPVFMGWAGAAARSPTSAGSQRGRRQIRVKKNINKKFCHAGIVAAKRKSRRFALSLHRRSLYPFIHAGGDAGFKTTSSASTWNLSSPRCFFLCSKCPPCPSIHALTQRGKSITQRRTSGRSSFNARTAVRIADFNPTAVVVPVSSAISFTCCAIMCQIA